MESSRFDLDKLDNYIIQFMLAVEEQDGEKFCLYGIGCLIG